jgi:hypothetical protein
MSDRGAADQQQGIGERRLEIGCERLLDVVSQPAEQRDRLGVCAQHRRLG